MKLRYLIVLLTLLALPAQAAEPLGKLFTTPAERATLERLRQNSQGLMLEQALPAADDNATAAPPVTPHQLSVQGYVRRSDGARGTVWVNHQPLQERSEHNHVQVGSLPREGSRDSNRVPLTIPDTGSQVKLKAGQAYDGNTGQISERNVHGVRPESQALEQGEIR